MKLIRIHCHTDRGETIAEYQMECHPDLLTIYNKMGIIDLKDDSIHFEDLLRLKKILRLKKNCGVNTIGATIIVELLEKIENMQDEIERLRRK